MSRRACSAKREAGNEVLVVVSAMAGETDRLVQLCREAAALHDPTEYDVVVASGEQVTAGLLAMTLQNMGLKARSFMGWQLVRASGVHGNARVEAIESATLDEALSNGTVAVIPGFQGISDDGRLATLGRGGSDTSAVAIAAGREGRPLRHLHRRRRRLHHRPAHRAARRASWTPSPSKRCSNWPGVGAKVLQTRSVGLAMRDNLPLRVLSAFEDKPGTRIVARAVRSGHGKKPDRGHRRRQERGAGHADRHRRRAGHGRASHQPARRSRHPGRHDRPRCDSQHRRRATSPSPCRAPASPRRWR